MLKSIPFANAVTVVTVVVFIICVLLAYFAPNFLYGIANSWFHGFNLQSVRTATPPPVNSVIYGLITMAVLTWVTTYVTIELYNRWAKK